MFKLIAMLTCIRMTITTAVINPNMTCDLIKEPVLLIRDDSTNQLMLLNPSSNDVTSAIKVDLDDYKGNTIVQQTRNTLIIFYWISYTNFMMKVHNLITTRSNEWFTFVGHIGRSPFFTLDDKLYCAKLRGGGFMDYNKGLNKLIESTTITPPSGYQPNVIVEFESRPCFLVKSQTVLQFNCYHSDQNKWNVRAKLLSAPSDSRIWSAQVYHNEIFICYRYYNDNKDQCIVYNIKTKSTHTSTQAEQSAKPPVTESIENSTFPGNIKAKTNEKSDFKLPENDKFTSKEELKYQNLKVSHVDFKGPDVIVPETKINVKSKLLELKLKEATHQLDLLI